MLNENVRVMMAASPLLGEGLREPVEFNYNVKSTRKLNTGKTRVKFVINAKSERGRNKNVSDILAEVLDILDYEPSTKTLIAETGLEPMIFIQKLNALLTDKLLKSGLAIVISNEYTITKNKKTVRYTN